MTKSLTKETILPTSNKSRANSARADQGCPTPPYLEPASQVEQRDCQNNPAIQVGETGSNKAKETISFLATAVLPVLGALGTLFVFLMANFYVGDVEIDPDISFQTLEVHAYNKKGQEAVFHSPHFQLMPDNYHFEISVDSAMKQHANASVRFREHTLVKISRSPSPQEAESAKANNAQAGSAKVSDEPASGVKKKHWWQFWKKTEADKILPQKIKQN